MFIENKKSGFTLIEMTVVIAIIAILAVTTFVGYNSFRKRTQLNIIAEEIESALKLTQSKTLSSLNKTRYGVHFDTDKYITFIGDTYNPVEATNITFAISDNLEIYNISLNGGGSEVIFKRLTGKTDQYGSLNLRIKNTSQERILNIESSGTISVN